MKDKKGRLVIIVGPSASGKTELVRALLERIPNSVRIATLTTRDRRPTESDTKDYFFVTRDEFEKRIQKGDLIEYAEVYGNLYGVSREILDKCLSENEYVFAIIDVKGAQTIKSKMPQATTFFLRPGSIEDIKERILTIRAGISKEELQKRIDTAEYELSLAEKFDVVFDNIQGRFEDTVEKVIHYLSVE